MSIFIPYFQTMKYLLAACTLYISSISFGQSDSSFNLSDFLADNSALDRRVEQIYNSLNDTSKVAQLIMPAAGRYGSSTDSINQYVNDGIIGGILLLNGTKDQFKNLIKTYKSINENLGHLPFLYSADAEPSLVNRKMTGSTRVLRASEIKTIEQLEKTAQVISDDLNEVGINYNFAPVVDVSSNKTVGYRGFGAEPKNIIPFSNKFISVTQRNNIIATAKHFPGHGLVSGDTHKSLQIIDGQLKELQTYPPLIEQGVLSIMVAHIAVKNNAKLNTNGAPATVSKTIVKDLLRDSLNFNGLIVTDAMNMGGIAKVPQAAVKAIEAGCDIVLMPLNARTAHRNILTRYLSDKDYKKSVDSATKRIIRMKICLGLLN